MNIIFTIQGGLGKSVVGTAVCKAIKKKYPSCKLIVLTGYPEVFTNNKEVDMAFGLGQEAYFYSKYIDGQEVKIFGNDPYQVTEHILNQEHLIETWCKMNGLEYNGEMPSVELNERERVFYFNKYQFDKPIFILQTHGGAPQQDNMAAPAVMPSRQYTQQQPQGKGGRNVTMPGQGGQPRMGMPNAYSNTIQPWDNASIQPQAKSGKGKG